MTKYYSFSDMKKHVGEFVDIEPIRAMIYTNAMHDGKVLYKGKYKGYEYYVISYGTHPCCYLLLDKNNPYYKKEYDDIPLDVHGGLTYSSNKHISIDNKNNKWIIGWDYAHLGDRYGNKDVYHFICYDHTYKTKELIRDCIKAIDELIEICEVK